MDVEAKKRSQQILLDMPDAHLNCAVSVGFGKVPPRPLASDQNKGWDSKRVLVKVAPSPLSALTQMHGQGLCPLVVQFVLSPQRAVSLLTTTTLSLASPKQLFPPAPEWGLYAPSVLVLQNEQGEWLDEKARFKCSVLSLCATRKTEITAEGLFRTKGDAACAERRIWKLFSMAQEWNHDSVLIDEWGCEEQDGPINTIPRLFAKSLQERGWTKHFKSIVFLARSEKTRQFWETILHTKKEEE